MISPAHRLRAARIHAGYKSARQAALDNNWPESTYRAHETENSGRPLTLRAAEVYADVFGVKASWLLHESESAVPSDLTPQPRVDDKRKNISGALGDSNASERFAPPKFPDKPIPIHGIAMSGKEGYFILTGQITGHAICPPGLEDAPGVFSAYVWDDTVEPRYFSGEMIWANPTRAPARDDFVFIEMNGKDGQPGECFIRQYKGSTTSNVFLSKLKPKKESSIERKRIKSISVIVLSGKG